MISLSKLTKTYGLVPVLRGVNLQVQEGEFVTLVGPNGAGKSTLMRILASLIKPSAGEISIGGWSLPEQAGRVRRHLGYISHQSLLYGELSALDNLLFFARLYQLDSPEKRAETALRGVGLYGRRHDFVRTFSRGMTQRLTIARGTIHEPDILLLDEPYTGLDQSAIETLDQMLVNLHSEGRTILLITHDLLHGWRLANRVVVLHKGRLVGEIRQENVAEEDFLNFYREQIGA